MLTGDIRNQIDRIRDAFWSGGISNALEVIEQITYLLFLRASPPSKNSKPCTAPPLAERDTLFASLQHRAFRGEL